MRSAGRSRIRAAGCLAAVLLLFGPLHGSAETRPVQLGDTRDEYPLGAHIDILEDPTRELTFEQVSSDDYGERFEAPQSAEPNVGLSKSAWWVRFELDDRSSASRDWLLELDWPTTDNAELFTRRDDGTLSVQRAGDLWKLESRELRTRQPTFPLHLDQDGDRDRSRHYYLRVTSENSQVLALTIWQRDAFFDAEFATLLLFGVLYGALFLMISSSIVLRFVTGDSIYVSYAVSSLGFGIWDACTHGFLYRFVWDVPWWSSLVIHWAPLAAAFGQFYFARGFLGMQHLTPRIDRGIRAYLVISIALSVLPLLGYAQEYVRVVVPGGIGVSVGIFWTAVVALRNGSRLARVFLLSWSLSLVGYIPIALRGLGVAPSNFLTEYGLQVGMVLTFLSLWLALVGRVQDAVDEIAALNAGLEASIRDRTRELERTTEELTVANAARRRFLATASHDLRQPIHAVSLLVGALSGRVREPGTRQLIHRLEESAEGVGDLFDSLLDMSKLDAGMVVPSRTGVALQPLFDRLVADLEHQALRKGIELRAAQTDAVVESDALMLRRILQNLITNAIRYTDAGHVELRASDRAGRVRIEVVDTGRGISRAERERIFEEYERLGAEDPEGEGLGLGLAIVRRLVDLLGHTLDLESTVGEGSTFSLELESGGARVATSDPALPTTLEGKTILAVDDDIAVVEGLRELLASWGCQPLCASSIARARAEVDRIGRAPDLIVTDYQLGEGETGFDVIDAVRADAASVVPAVLLTGDSSASPAEEAERRGLLLLRKPVPPMRLRAALTRALG